MSFDVVLWDATTEGIHSPEAGLRVGLALLVRLAIPGDGFGIITSWTPGPLSYLSPRLYCAQSFRPPACRALRRTVDQARVWRAEPSPFEESHG